MPRTKKTAENNSAIEENASVSSEGTLAEKETAETASEKKTTTEKTPAKRGRKKKLNPNKILKEADGEKQLIIDPSIDKSLYAKCAIDNEEVLTVLIDSLEGSQRRLRQFSASIIGEIAAVDSDILAGFIPNLCDALHRPEAQTRWCVLEALYELIPEYTKQCRSAIAGAELSLDDEESGLARLVAFKFLCRLCEFDSKSSKEVWPLIDEAIQCYHGDLEFGDMLTELQNLASGQTPKSIKKELAARMKFDAESSKGSLQKRAEAIIKACNE